MTHPPKANLDLSQSESLKDSPAARKALDFYLAPEIARQPSGQDPFTVRADVGAVEALNHACGLLRCAAATAYESADALHGPQRDLAFSVVHMVNLARSMVDRSIDGYPQSPA